MNDFAPQKIYGGPQHNYDVVWFEDRREWFIRSTDRATGEQAYSSEGYGSKLEAAKAFEGRVTYVAEPPGQT